LILQKNTKNSKSLLKNLLHRGPLKTTSGATCDPRIGQPWPNYSFVPLPIFKIIKMNQLNVLKIIKY